MPSVDPFERIDLREFLDTSSSGLNKAEECDCLKLLKTGPGKVVAPKVVQSSTAFRSRGVGQCHLLPGMATRRGLGRRRPG